MAFDPGHASRDALTGLLDRRGFHESIQRPARGWPAHRRMGLALIDVVHLHLVNAKRGRADGDAALRCIAAAIPVVAPHEWASRYGGDEFAALLAIDESSEAQSWGNEARAVILAAVERELGITLDVRIGVSLGAPGWWPTDVYAQALTPADGALARAMHSESRGDVVVDEMWPEAGQ